MTNVKLRITNGAVVPFARHYAGKKARTGPGQN